MELIQQLEKAKIQNNNQAGSLNLGIAKSIAIVKQYQNRIKPELPLFVINDIEKLEGKYMYDISYYSDESIGWIESSDENIASFYKALVVGYKKQHQKRWIVCKDKKYIVYQVTNDSIKATLTSKKDLATPFYDFEVARNLAYIMDGSVREYKKQED
ncbi:hypothetical protein [Enterococcus sp. N249-2]